MATDSLPVVTAALTIHHAEREERSILPEEVIPVNPEAAPVVEISQLEELTATVAELFPRVVTPVEDNAVNAPVFGVVDPIASGAAHVPPIKEEALMVPDPVEFNDAPVPTTMAAVVLVPEVIPEKGTEVAAIVEVQVGATPAPDEIRNCPLVPGRLFGIKAPEKRKFPATSSFSVGEVVPIPTLPLDCCTYNCPEFTSKLLFEMVMSSIAAPPPILILSDEAHTFVRVEKTWS